ncbi:MAG: glycosyltransferase [Myxococcota bacterium]
MTSDTPVAPRYAVAVLHYRARDALARCLASVAAQSAAPALVCVVDIDPLPGAGGPLDGAPLAAGADAFVVAMPNRGYAGAANRALAAVAARGARVDHVLLLTADVALEPAFAAELARAVEARPDVAIATGKLLRADGATIDSAGIRLPLHRRPRDRGSEEPDRGQWDRCERVFGASGAALWLRASALDALALEGEVFDEDFFMYHEDTDLAWRARRLGLGVLYVPDARARHERGWKRSGRFDVPVALRRHSFKNHYLQWIKNEPLATLVLGLPVFLGWEVLRLGYACLRDPDVLPAYGQALRLAPRALAKRRALARAVRARRAARR